jgi:E3 ubiquitin-protein ligase UBR4
MLGNPYSSTEPGLGPLMRDVKNKICQDCELVALLEDDNGMELLVNNKIISLDLPVREVCIYQFFWKEICLFPLCFVTKILCACHISPIF